MAARLRKSIARAAAAVALMLSALAAAPGQTTDAVIPAAPKFIGARGIALGDAIGSDEFDVEAMYQNPATLSFLRRPDVLIDQRHGYPNQVFQENIAGRLFANRFIALGIGLGAETAGKLTHGGPFNFTQEDLDAAVAFRPPGVSSDLSFGLLGNFKSGRTDAGTRSAARLTAGLMYSPSPGTSYSAVFRGMGTDLVYNSVTYPEGRLTQSALVQVPRSLELGSTMRYPASSGKPYLTISISGEKDFEAHTLRVRGGIETIIMDLLSLRVGYVNAEVRQLRLGAGIAIGRLIVDYAVMPVQNAGKFDEVTLKVTL